MKLTRRQLDSRGNPVTYDPVIPRRTYEMTPEDLRLFRAASSPETYHGIVLGDQKVNVVEATKQFWAVLGARMGFKWWTVEPHPSKDPLRFTAIPRPPGYIPAERERERERGRGRSDI